MTTRIPHGPEAAKRLAAAMTEAANTLVREQGALPFDLAVGLVSSGVMLLSDPAVCSPDRGRAVLEAALQAFDAPLPDTH